MRILAISDPHGCYDKLVELINKIQYNPKNDKLVLLGDYVDRGKQSMETLLYVGELIKNGAVALMGNHDEIFKELLDNDSLESALNDNYYKSLGAYITIKDYLKLDQKDKNKVKSILSNLLPYYQIDKYIFSHAGVNAFVSLDMNSMDDLIWSREEFYNYKAYSGKICIFGHTPTTYLYNDNVSSLNCGIWHDPIHKDKVGIDCACIFGGKLACIDLTNMKEYYV